MRQEFKQIGMDAGKIKVLGNAKYDALAAMAVIRLCMKTSPAAFNVRKDEKFLVAGSTHPGEEDVVIQVYQRIAEALSGLQINSCAAAY